jgi:hypothetical protein
MILAVGLLAIAAAGGLAATHSGSAPARSSPASWGLYSPTDWSRLATSFARRGLAADSVRVVTGTALQNGRPFALLGGRTRNGRTCFAVARGAALGATVCRFSKPVTLFEAPETCAPCSPGRRPLKTLELLGLVRADMTVTMISQGRESGLGVVPAGSGFAFNADARNGDGLRARDASGRVLAAVHFRVP